MGIVLFLYFFPDRVWPVLVPREVFMKLLQSLVAQVSLRTQGGILALGILFILLDLITEPLYPVIDLAWVTVIVCGLPLLINSVQSIWDNLEIHANFLIVVAMVALRSSPLVIIIQRLMWASWCTLASSWSNSLQVRRITPWMLICYRLCQHSL